MKWKILGSKVASRTMVGHRDETVLSGKKEHFHVNHRSAAFSSSG
jgi:hypothetical protein